jgi:hypothetical protein
MLDELPVGIAEAQRDLPLWRLLQIVRHHHTVGRILPGVDKCPYRLALRGCGLVVGSWHAQG